MENLVNLLIKKNLSNYIPILIKNKIETIDDLIKLRYINLETIGINSSKDRIKFYDIICKLKQNKFTMVKEDSILFNNTNSKLGNINDFFEISMNQQSKDKKDNEESLNTSELLKKSSIKRNLSREKSGNTTMLLNQCENEQESSIILKKSLGSSQNINTTDNSMEQIKNLSNNSINEVILSRNAQSPELYIEHNEKSNLFINNISENKQSKISLNNPVDSVKSSSVYNNYQQNNDFTNKSDTSVSKESFLSGDILDTESYFKNSNNDILDRNINKEDLKVSTNEIIDEKNKCLDFQENQNGLLNNSIGSLKMFDDVNIQTNVTKNKNKLFNKNLSHKIKQNKQRPEMDIRANKKNSPFKNDFNTSFYDSSLAIKSSVVNKKDRSYISSIFKPPIKHVSYPFTDAIHNEIKQRSNMPEKSFIKSVSRESQKKEETLESSMPQKIIVCVRKKPLEDYEKDIVQCQNNNILVHENKKRLDLSSYMHQHSFFYDHVFNENITNEQIFEDVKGILKHVYSGGNSSIIAYGQTGTGKTHTMFHPRSGIVYQCIKDIVDNHKKGYISFYEIYNGQLFDLFDYRENVNIREKDGSVYLQDLNEKSFSTVEEAWGYVDEGISMRMKGVTGANNESSRSHAILKISFIQNCLTNEGNCLMFVDLAGSERGSDRKNVDSYTKIEGAEINKSLLALKECIRGIDSSKLHLPFRQSKLTQVLKNAFIGNSMTCIIATINPAKHCIEHTINTLRYVDKIKGFNKNRQDLNQTVVNNSNISEFQQNTTSVESSRISKHYSNTDNINFEIQKSYQKQSFDCNYSQESTKEEKMQSVNLSRNLQEKNAIVIYNKKIVQLSKKIVSSCDRSGDIKLLKNVIEMLKNIDLKIVDMKF